MALTRRQRVIGDYLQRWKAHTLVTKNGEAPLNKHWDLSVGDYVDNPVEEGKHFDYDTYQMVAD
jgi:hypothetical protein